MNFLKNWQGLVSLVVALILFFVLPFGLRIIDPTAGAFDAGYIARPFVALIYLLVADFAMWLMLWISFRSLDKWCDAGSFNSDWTELTPRGRIITICAVLAVELLTFIACLFAVPVA